MTRRNQNLMVALVDPMNLLGLGGLGGGFFGLAAAVRTLLLGFVVGMGLLVVLAALPAEEEQNPLRISAHAHNLRHWSPIEKCRTVRFWRLLTNVG